MFFEMFEKIWNSEHKEKSQWEESEFLAKQLKQMPKRILKTLSESNNEDFDWEKTKYKTERDAIKDMFYKKSDYLWRRAILWDILSYSLIELWKEEKDNSQRVCEVTQFKCKYGLWITVNNITSLLNFCAIHGFIPLVDKIYIEWKDVSKVRELSSLFSFTWKNAYLPRINPQIPQVFWNESEKLKIFQKSSQRALSCLERIYKYNEEIYPYLMWDNLEKHDDNNIGASSENIFVEIAIRLENQIREKIWIESSYMFLAWYNNDHNEKTDMHFVIKKTPKQKPRIIPVQFTTSWKKWQQDKEKDLEDYLIKKVESEDDNTKNKIRSHIMLTVNGEFAKHLTHHVSSRKEKYQENKEFIIINEDYKNWINNPQEREKYDGSKFPLFSYRLDSQIIEPAEIIYMALHMLYKQYSFRYTTKETYLKSFKDNTEIEKNNPFEINGIKLSDISIGECFTEMIYADSHFRSPLFLKHKFQICYQWKHMWVIVIYEAKQKNGD